MGKYRTKVGQNLDKTVPDESRKSEVGIGKYLGQVRPDFEFSGLCGHFPTSDSDFRLPTLIRDPQNTFSFSAVQAKTTEVLPPVPPHWQWQYYYILL